jgi:hypothetical protein
MARQTWAPILLLSAALGGMLLFAILAAVDLWRASGVDIGWFGWSVLAAGAVMSVALGAGLMALSFHSARRGYDARADAAAREIESAAERSLDQDGGRGG